MICVDHVTKRASHRASEFINNHAGIEILIVAMLGQRFSSQEAIFRQRFSQLVVIFRQRFSQLVVIVRQRFSQLVAMLGQRFS